MSYLIKKHLLSYILFIWIFLAGIQVLDAQEESTLIYNIISELTEQLEDENTSPEYIYDVLTRLAERPINLNHPEAEILVDIRLINSIQWTQLQNHIELYGKLISIYELQTIPEWDMNTINRLSYFAKVDRNLEDLHLSLSEMFRQSDYLLAFFGERQWPLSNGYKAKSDTVSPAFEGNPWRQYVRLRAQYQYRLSAGITLEKDAGEALFKGSNDHFDFSSFHLYAQQLNKWIKRVAIGDYKVNIGQGLIVNSSYGGGKSAYVTDIKKGGKYFRPHASTSEIAFYRGAAVELTPSRHLTSGFFYSNLRRDGNLGTIDTLSGDPGSDIQEFTSLQTSGLHRTKAEIEDEKQIKHQVIGGKIGYNNRMVNINLNALNSSFNKPLERSIKPYNQFYFRGDQLLNLSIDYAVDLGSLHLFGESAYSDNGAFAHLAGLKTGLSKDISFVGLFRTYPRDYHSIEPNAFGETRTANNESGLFLGLDWNINRQFRISAYADTWKHQWLRSSVDQPTKGNEYLFRFRYYLKRQLEVYAQYKREIKAVNISDNQSFKSIEDRFRNQLRVHMNLRLGGSIEWRSRAEYNHVQVLDEHSEGYMLYQDFIYRPLQKPLSFSCRYVLFKTDDYDSRIYAYENDLLYNFSLPAYFNSGRRFYINLRYRPVKSVTLEARYAQTQYTDIDEIGSGHDKINASSKHEAAFQFRLTF